MRWRFRLSLITLCVLATCLHASRVFAANEFTSSLSSTYDILSGNLTHVTQSFTLKNNVSTVYITEYALEVGSNRITNVTAQSNGTALVPTITPHGNKTSIAVHFADKVVGKDQVRQLTVSYDSPDIAQQTGSILEVNIPKLANASEFNSYSVSIKTGSEYNAPSLAHPETFTTSHENGKTVVNFANVGQDGISLLFGNQQGATLDLEYHLENPTSQKGSIHIALPPDTPHQRLSYTAIDPPPGEITSDSDGNWLAQYILDPGQKLNVHVTGTVLLTLSSQDHTRFITQRPGPEYLAPSTYWETNDSKVRTLASQLKTPKAIYDYVVRTLNYNYTRLQGNGKRLGAVEALKNPTDSVCTEFTDTFIAIARAAGIPAREVNGYAYTQNDTLRPLSLVHDVLHAWPEYWDDTKGQWMSIDPTWGNTTGGVDYFSHFDFNHIAFVIHGKDSQQPIAAGMYKFVGDETKDVTVNFTGAVDTTPDNLTSMLLVHAHLLFNIKSPYGILVKNNSLHAVYDVPYAIRTVHPDGNTSVDSGTLSLLPLSSKEIAVQLPSSSLFSPAAYTIETRVGTQIHTDHVNVQSFITSHKTTLAILVFVGFCAAISAFITWRLLVPRRRR